MIRGGGGYNWIDRLRILFRKEAVEELFSPLDDEGQGVRRS